MADVMEWTSPTSVVLSLFFFFYIENPGKDGKTYLPKVT